MHKTNNSVTSEHQSMPLYAQRNNNNRGIVLSEQQQVNVRKKLDQLRQQFYSEFLDDDKHRPKAGQLKVRYLYHFITKNWENVTKSNV